MARVAIPVSDKQVFKTGNIMRQRYFIVKRGEIPERQTCINAHGITLGS